MSATYQDEDDASTCATCDQYLDQSKRYIELRDRFKGLEIEIIEQHELLTRISELEAALVKSCDLADRLRPPNPYDKGLREQIAALRAIARKV